MTTYPVTVNDKVVRYCPSCDSARLIYVESDGAQANGCCCMCSRIIRHGKELDVLVWAGK